MHNHPAGGHHSLIAPDITIYTIRRKILVANKFRRNYVCNEIIARDCDSCFADRGGHFQCAATSTTSFIYDGDGNLVKKVHPDGSRTLYVAGIYEVDKLSGGTVEHTRTYYPVAGAMRVDGTLYFMLRDHLGSTSMVTDASGNIVGQQRYYPFGETRYTSGTMYTDKLFTGQRQITDLGIYYYNARFYSPYINRFLSADTIVPGYTDPQSLNRYSYVNNNPLRYTDPTGHVACGDGEAHDCNGNKQDPDQNPHPPNQTPHAPKLPKSPKKEDEDGDPVHCLKHLSSCDTGIPTPSSSSTQTQLPNPSLNVLIPLAIAFTVTTAVVEIAVVAAEGAMTPIDAAMPIVGIPLSLTLAAAGAAVLDLDIAFIVYTARVADNPEVHQDFVILPLWGLNK
jgi:RHS repeat-associated protein